MRNITVSVTHQTCRRARVWAAGRDTSVSAAVQCLPETLPGIQRAAQASPALKSAPDSPPSVSQLSENVLL
ncbi:MAG: hypothetical protein ABR923_05275 [Terracidiphilus sp.]